MSNARYTAMTNTLHFQPTPSQREIRRRPARDFTLHRPHQTSASSFEEANPLV